MTEAGRGRGGVRVARYENPSVSVDLLDPKHIDRASLATAQGQLEAAREALGRISGSGGLFAEPASGQHAREIARTTLAALQDTPTPSADADLVALKSVELAARARDLANYLAGTLLERPNYDATKLLEELADHSDAILNRLTEAEGRADYAKEQRDALNDALHDLVMLHAQGDIGCVPSPTREQWEQAWAYAEDLVRVEP